MPGVLDGVKVLEVAGWVFVSAAGAVLTDWGAEVIKVEHPEQGDPQRGLNVGAVGTKGPGGVSFIFEQPNRGKRSIGLNIATEDGRQILLDLAAQCDVFLTNLLQGSLQRLRLTVDDVRAANPNIIYARGTGQGVRGDEADKAGFDGSSYFARGGISHMFMDPDAEWPPIQRPAFGDVMGGFALASGIAGALFQRERTGRPSIVDVSLLGVATWQLSPDIVATGLLGEDRLSRFTMESLPNPIVNVYRTSDDRFVQLMMLQGDRFWPEVCDLVERPELLNDPRFSTDAARFENRVACIAELRRAFATRPLAEWRTRMKTLDGAWAIVQTPSEVLTDPQVIDNGYIRPVMASDGKTEFSLVANPVQFDETPPDLTRAPEVGEHTDEILQQELGLDWDRIIELKLGSIIN